uniref:Uncharacterized protein n=1 Tax=mine drainage metagenome TaxID=410659 RepID=E6QLZ4_9ZZZZ
MVGLISYFPFAWYIHRYMDDAGYPPGFVRKLVVFVLASILASLASYCVSWI